MQTLEEFAQENPFKARKSVMESPELTEMVKEGVQAIKNGMQPTIVAHWIMKYSPIELEIKHDTVRQWLYDKARDRI
tara:strand:- start:558 stop:788 length:231 start_codon:yes stop_codon:yes gene_type:complete